MHSVPTSGQEPAGLTIGQLSSRTGLAPAVLRMWEQRHGFPQPRRLASGHRRYAEEDVTLVSQVLERKEAGMRLELAIAQARATRPPQLPSIFAEIRARHDHLVPQRLRKPTLTALSWAIEDECAARAERPLLLGAFQTAALFAPSRPRWRELARVSTETIALAAFDLERPRRQDGIIQVPLSADTVLLREWAVVCDSTQLPVCLSAWELPGQAGVPDHRRVFECVWSVEPSVVRAAARTGAAVATAARAQLSAEAGALLDSPATPGQPDVRDITALFSRMIAYVDRTRSS